MVRRLRVPSHDFCHEGFCVEERRGAMDSAGTGHDPDTEEEPEADLVKLAYQYVTTKTYPEGCMENRKRTVRRKQNVSKYVMERCTTKQSCPRVLETEEKCTCINLANYIIHPKRVHMIKLLYTMQVLCGFVIFRARVNARRYCIPATLIPLWDTWAENGHITASKNDSYG